MVSAGLFSLFYVTDTSELLHTSDIHVSSDIIPFESCTGATALEVLVLGLCQRVMALSLDCSCFMTNGPGFYIMQQHLLDFT